MNTSWPSTFRSLRRRGPSSRPTRAWTGSTSATGVSLNRTAATQHCNYCSKHIFVRVWFDCGVRCRSRLLGLPLAEAVGGHSRHHPQALPRHAGREVPPGRAQVRERGGGLRHQSGGRHAQQQGICRLCHAGAAHQYGVCVNCEHVCYSVYYCLKYSRLRDSCLTCLAVYKSRVGTHFFHTINDDFFTRN